MTVRVSTLLRHGVLLTVSALVLVPFVLMTAMAFQAPDGGAWPSLANFSRALTVVPFGRFLLNGVLVAGVVTAVKIAVAAPCAYALAKLRFRGRDLLTLLVMVCLLVPQQVLALPLFLMLNRVGLLDSYVALILPFAISPTAIFLFRQVFRAVPDDVVAAARLDGLSEWAIVWRVMVPIAAPTVAAYAILSVIGRWNDLFWPSVVVTSEHLMPPALGVLFFRNDEAGDEYGPLMAAALLVVAPLLIAFLVAQRRFIEGLSLGGASKST